MEPEGSLPYSQLLATYPYPELTPSTTTTTTTTTNNNNNIRIRVVVRFKTFGRQLNFGTMGSNSAEGMKVRLLCLLCVV
jgi:hypothetical protein